jgi:hypothetical protein
LLFLQHFGGAEMTERRLPAWRIGLRSCPYFLVLAISISCTQTKQTSPDAGGVKRLDDPVRITQFYATKTVVSRGEEALLCYGVENAVAVRMAPAIEPMWPAMSRCITISPSQTTTFTLVAEDRRARTTSASVTVKVADPLPHFTDLSISSGAITRGEVVAFCFKAINAVAVRGKPGYFLHGGAPRGDCLVNQPRQTTSYRITIEGADGRTDDAAITVTVH